MAEAAAVTLKNATINGVNDELYEWSGIACEGGAVLILEGSNHVKGFYEEYPGIHVSENKTLTIKGIGANVKLSIADGASIALKDLTINGENNESYKWAGINCDGDAVIFLEGTNSVKGFYENYPGIHVSPGTTLTIKGRGELTASSNGYGTGIGGGWCIPCGNIVIEGGTITATGGYKSSGIGGGYYGNCDSITITDKVTKVTATKGVGASDSIGAGGGLGTCGTVTIGGQVGAITKITYTYKP